MMMKFVGIVFLTLALVTGYAQTGPGGVGTTSGGTSSLVLWLDANRVSATNGSTVTSWNDVSGYGNNFNAGAGAVYTTNVQNGYPGFSFNGSSHYFQASAYNSTITPSVLTVFSVTRPTSSGSYKAVFSNRDDASGNLRGFILYAVPTSNNWEFWTGKNASGWDVSSSGASTAGSWATQMAEYQSGTSGKKATINGTLMVSSTHTMFSNAARAMRVGAGQNESTANFYFNGFIAEIIMYNVVINRAQKIIINNSLAAKYGITSIYNNTYDEDNAANGDFDHNVAGIGRANSSNIHNAAQGTGVVTVLNPSGLGDNEFFMWGHDDGTLQATETSDVPTGVAARFDRIWRVSETDSLGTTGVDVGSIDMRWNLTGLGAVTASDLRLLVDTDNDGIFSDETPISGATSVGSNVYQFTTVSAIANNMRFTLGTINKSQTPLPIELINFTGQITDGESVLLNWQTASELNNDYFTIERSKDGINWIRLADIDGAGNSSVKLNYSYIDDYSLSGISYYRLRQTDIGGKASYSQIISVHTANIKSARVKIYPNPTFDRLVIKGDENELAEITIYNSRGQNITDMAPRTKGSDPGIIIDLSGVENGIYFIKTKTSGNIVCKQ